MYGYFIVGLGLLGLCMGSFVNALVWRLHKNRDFVRERSECTHCHHVLAWYDLVPVVSWLSLRGRCRYCHQPIEDSPLVELGVSGLFVLSYIFWPFGFATVASQVVFGLWLVVLVLLAALFVYDQRWSLLPDKLVFPLIGLACVVSAMRFFALEKLAPLDGAFMIAGGVTVMSGLYAVLYVVSKGAWVGFGDVKLNIALGAMLGWSGALLAVFLANILGVLVVVPGLLSKKLTRRSRVPFGPFLIAAFVITWLWGRLILDWYVAMIFAI